MSNMVTVIIIIGILISLVNLPGQWLIFLTALVLKLNDVSSLGWSLIVIFFTLSVIASVADNILMLWSVKKSGGTKWGLIGAILGLIVGVIIGGFFGAILGPFVGAFLCEYLIAKRTSSQAFKAGIGTVFGLLGGIIVKFSISLAMGLWLISILN